MSNSLEAKLHELWAADAVLDALLPAARVFTGRVPPETATPCARIELSGSTLSERSNQSLFHLEIFRVGIWTDDLNEGRLILRAVENAFVNLDFEIGEDRVLDAKHDASTLIQSEDPDDTTWQIVCQFTAKTSRARPELAVSSSSSSSGSSSGQSSSS